MRKFWSLLLAALLLVGIVHNVTAQTYRFSVPRNDVSVYVNPDGTATIEYMTEFQNSSGGSPLDFIDIGLPNDKYDLSTITATVDGKKITDIQKSEYVTHGVALGLGGNAIQPGRSGLVQVYVGKVEGIFYTASAKEAEAYASFQFMPNFFGSEYVSGDTDMTVTLYLPAGLQENEPRYFTPNGWPGDAAPESNYDQKGRVYYRWHSTAANSSTEYTFGASFPARLIPESAISRPPAFNISSDNLCCFGVFAFIAGITGLGIYSSTIGAKKRKLAYLPPKISIEGNGIKRGLTAVEAAVLMEQPLDKVMTMTLFGLLKKGAAEVTTKDPLELKIASPLPDGLYPYEQDFLDAFKSPNGAERKKKLQTMMIGLVKSISEKMKGFSRKETITFYEDIQKRAWEQVEQAGTPEVKSQKYNDVLEWTMLDRDYDDHTRRTFSSGPVFLPNWWWRFDPTYSSSTFTGAGTAHPAGGMASSTPVSLPNLPGSSFASSVVGSVQSFASGVLGDVTGFTSGVTNATNPPPPPSTSTRSGGGGHSGGCACACACAGCACACAGGGR